MKRLRALIDGLSLRTRIAGTMLALVAAAGILLVTWAHLADKRLEANVTDDLLSEELTHYEQRLRTDPGAEPLQSAQLRIYRSQDIAQLPRDIARFRPGTYGPIRLGGRYLRVLVRDGEFGRLYITYDVTTHETEQRIAVFILVAGVLGTIVLTAWVAFGLSGRLVGPVHQLANRLGEIDPGDRHVRFAPEFAGNELEPIARSIDTFLERLDGFVEREQSFTSTASHELRTPLTVIRGAVELLNEQARDNPQTQKALARIQRAVREMSDFTDALLTLSREEQDKGPAHTSCDVTAMLQRIVEDQRAMVRDKNVTMKLESGPPLRVPAPDSMVAMVVGNLVRNALQHGQGRQVECRLQGRALQVANTGEIAGDHLAQVFNRSFSTRPGGHGMGLYLVRRICDRYGWDVKLESSVQGTLATVVF